MALWTDWEESYGSDYTGWGTGWQDEYAAWQAAGFLNWDLFGDVQAAMQLNYNTWLLQQNQAAAAAAETTLIDSDGDGQMDQLVDVEGNVLVDYSDIWAALDEVAATELPSFTDWMAEQGQGFYDPMAVDEEGNYIDPALQGIQALIAWWEQGPSETDIANAYNYAGTMFGMTGDEFTGMINQLTTETSGGVLGMEDMTPEEIELRERINRTQIQQAEERASRMIGNIQASTGSATRAYMMADQQLRQINDAQLQQELSMADEILRRQQAQWESKNQQAQQMLQSGHISTAEYMDMLESGHASAYLAYCMQVATSLAQNSEYLAQYQADYNSIVGNIQNTYNAIQMELGLNAEMLQAVSDWYETNLAPILVAMDFQAMQMEIDDLYSSSFWDTFADVVSVVVDIASIFSSVPSTPETELTLGG